MTSPVDTSVKIFRSAMVGAPVLSGTAGTMKALLDAVLKDGFDLKTLTSLVALGGVMTATWSGTHSSEVDSIVLIAGVTGGPTGFLGANGEQKVVTRPGASSAAWATALPDGTYTGTITMKMAPLGFASPYTGTNLAVYKSTDPAATQFCLRLDDTGTTTARVIGYETMSDVNTGTGPFPTTAQVSGGLWWSKSQVANTTAIPWEIIGDSRGFYFARAHYYSSSNTYTLRETVYFGDFISRKAGDAFNCILTGQPSAAFSAANSSGDVGYATASNFQNLHAQYVARSYTQVGGSVPTFKGGVQTFQGSSNQSRLSGTNQSGYLGTYPNGPDNALDTYMLDVAEGTSDVSAHKRGRYPGLFHTLQYVPPANFGTMDTIIATGDLAGKKLRTMRGVAGSNVESSTAGVYFFDGTGPWR